MSPPASRRDELVTILLERLDRFEAALSAVQQIVARIDATAEQARVRTGEIHIRLDAQDARITSLEAVRHRAEGAAWLGKLFWVGLGAALPALGAAATYFLR